jgi:MFS family permease
MNQEPSQPADPEFTRRSGIVSFFTTTFSALSQPNYRLMWLGAIVSNIGTWIQKIAQPWLILSLTGSSFLLGLDGFMQDFPLLVFLLFGGAISDRFSRKKILIFSNIVQFSGAATLAALTFTGKIEVWMILVISFVVGTVQSISTPAYLAVLPSLVSKAQLTNAIALNSLQFNVSRFIGPAVGGIVIASFGAAWCFGLNALSFAGLFGAFYLVQFPAQYTTEVRTHSITKSIGEGVQTVWSRPDLLSIIVIVFFVSFFAGPLLNFMPVVAKENLQSEAGGFSTLLSMFGAGAVVGAVRVAALKPESNRHQIVFIASVVLAAMVVAVAFSTVFALSMALVFVAGYAFVSCGSVGNTIVQSGVPDELRGRVISIYALAFRGGLPLGSLLTGIVAESFNITLALGLNGLCLLGVLAFAYRKFSPSLVAAKD